MKAKLFYSYCHKDEKFKEELKKSLSNLKRDKIIDDWDDRNINAGDSIPEEIKKHIESFHIILLLFSRDFIASKSCNDEVKTALELRKQKDTTVIPIILRPCEWKETYPDIKDISALPTDATPITKWENQDEAWLNITNGIRGVLNSEKFINKFLLESEGENKEFLNELFSKYIQNLFLSIEVEKKMAVKKLLQNDISGAIETLQTLDKEQSNRDGREEPEFLSKAPSGYSSQSEKEIIETKLELTILSWYYKPENTKVLLEEILEIQSYNLIARILYGALISRMGNTKEAINYNKKSLIISHKKGDKKIEAFILNNIGNNYLVLCKYAEASKYYNKTLEINRKIKNKEGEAGNLTNLGTVYKEMANYEKAIDYYTQSLKMNREIGNKEVEASTNNNIGMIYKIRGDSNKAINHFKQAREINLKIGNKEIEISSLSNLSSIYLDLGNFHKVIEYCNKTLEISKQIKSKEGECVSLGNLGSAYAGLSNYEKAMEYYNQALEISRNSGYQKREANNLVNISYVYLRLDNPQKAIDYLNQALKIDLSIKDKRGESQTLTQLSTAYLKLKEYDKVISYCNKALTIMHDIGSIEANVIIENLNNLINAHANLNQTALAKQYAEQLLKILNQSKSPQALELKKQLNNLGIQ